MCGIVGFLSNEEGKEKIIKKMNDRIVHRGPDGEGYYIDNNIALGHRRLAVIDLQSGEQPMSNERKDIIVIFNGEIYNYRELRYTLKERGHYFKTDSDTEVLLHGYEEWREELPKNLRGMFAFAIWDKRDNTLFCARDNFGIKPLYYYKTNEVFMFASEIKAFLEHPKFNKSVNKKIIGAYLSFSFTPTNETMFEGVYSLEPGKCITVRNNIISTRGYYDVEFEEKKSGFNDTVKRISNIVKDSVDYHTISDVEVGAFLSGGVDSSYIVSVAKPDKTYTIGYNEEKYSEMDYAKGLAKNLKIKNIDKKVNKQEYIKTLPKMLYYMDEPCADPSAISLYFLSKIASKDVKVVMSGEGADEFFGGYNCYAEEEKFKLYNKIPFFIRHIIGKCFELLPEFKGRNFIVRRGNRLEEEYVGVNKVFSEREIKKFLNIEENIKDKDIINNILKKEKHTLTKMQKIDIKCWLPKNILLKGDKMAMANSVEVRTPFVDKEVFEIAKSLPLEYKVTQNSTKIAFREAAKEDIPNESYKRKKLGFPVPLREWMREDDVYNEIKETINQNFVDEFFNRQYVLKLLEEHKNHKKDNYKKVWVVYVFIKWYEIFFLNNENIKNDSQILIKT